MSETWLVERGIGEDRYALIRNGEIVEAYVERPGELRAGSVHEGRLTRRHGSGGEAQIDGETCLIDPWPRGMAEGAAARLEVIREAIPERGRLRSAKVAIAGHGGTAAALTEGAVESYGWSELVEEARSGIIAFRGGLLSIVPTPAGTTIDVDGNLAPQELAIAGARASARAIRRLGLTGSVLIDLPSLEGRAVRAAAAEAFDAGLVQPYERTAVNGFGLLQVVRPRRRASLMERVQNQPIRSGALDLLRRAEMAGARQGLELRAGRRLVEELREDPALMAALARRVGLAPLLKVHGSDPLWWGDVHAL